MTAITKTTRTATPTVDQIINKSYALLFIEEYPQEWFWA